jgi:SNF2 family DNA or RNA helicase
MSPCLIRQDHTIFFVSEVDGSKLKPFITKDKIVIPKKTEDQYFKSFVLNAVNNFKVEGSGFEIKLINPEKEALLSIEIGLRGTPVLILKYKYEGKSIYASESYGSFTIFEKNNSNFIFRKFFRDLKWEKKCRGDLGDLGFFSDDDIHFSLLLPETGKRMIFIHLLEDVNHNYQELIDSGFLLTSRLDRNYNLLPVSIDMSNELVNDWFDLRAVVKIGKWNIPFSHFRNNILNDIREYELPDGTVAILPETWFARYKNLFALGKIIDDSLRIHKQHFSLLEDTFADESRNSHERLEKLLIPDQIPVVKTPAGLKCELRKYQAEGLNWLSFLQNSGLGGCLADDMGLGKTIQTLALLQHNKENMDICRE